MDDDVLRDIGRALEQALSNRGIGGKVVVRGHVAELHPSDRGRSGSDSAAPTGTVVAIELEWVNQWNVLPPDMQAERAELAARRLHNALEQADGRKIRMRGDGGAALWSTAKKLLAPLAAVAVAGTVAWWLYQSNFFGQAAETPADVSASAAPVGPAREQLACEAARKRLYAGASMGVDVAGWVVELWLARAVDRGKLAADGALSAALGKAAALAEGLGPAEVELQAQDRDGPLGVSSVVLTLSGGHVTAFFDSKGRAALERFATQLAIDAGANHAALYARCAHLRQHDVGAWYYGLGEADLGASLLYAAGAFAEPPVIDLDRLSSGALPLLSRKAAALEPELFERELTSVGGKLSHSEADAGPHFASLHFPLGGPTRAAKLSRSLAKAMEIAK